MKHTLLDLTQEVLSSMSSDEVNSIGDTSESMQVAQIIRRKTLDILSRSNLPELNGFIQLDASNDTDRPVLMIAPDDVASIEWIKYFDSNTSDGDTPNTYIHDLNVDIQSNGSSNTNGPPGYQYVTILPVRQFVDMIGILNPNETDVLSFTFEDITFYYKNNCQPKYCTIVNNKYIIFDSYDASVDDTLQNSKTLCFGRTSPTFRMEDDFVPQLEDAQFPLLLAEAKALAFFELKQQPHPLADREIKRQWSSLQKNKNVSRPSDFNELPDFGRQGGYTRGPYWYGKKY